MTHRTTITLDDEIFAFLNHIAGDNRSAYINKFAPRALHRNTPWGITVQKTKNGALRYANFKNTIYNALRGKTTGNCKFKIIQMIGSGLTININTFEY